MATLVKDRHKLIQHLQAKGFTLDQAEGFADAIGDLDVSDLATKEFVHAEVANLKSTIVMWFIGLEVATTALIVAVLR